MNSRSFGIALEHDPKMWVPVSRLREALPTACPIGQRLAGEGRSEKIMLKQQAKAKWRFNLIPFRFSHTSGKPVEKTRVPVRLRSSDWV
jgi:hypothetical protein